MMQQRRVMCPMALAIGFGSLMACAGSTTNASTTNAARASASSLRSIDWRNRTYVFDGSQVTLREGSYQARSGMDEARLSTALSEPVIYGDLTGDGVEEAAVLIFERQEAGPPEDIPTSAGIDTSMVVLVYTEGAFGEAPRLIGAVHGSEDELSIERTSIVNGVLSVHGQRQFEPEEQRYRWNGSELVPE